MTQYELSRNYFDWCFENPDKISPVHTAIYFFAIEHCNRLGWKSKFGFPSQMTMDALGIKKHQTYIKYFRDLVEWGFIILIQESKNQYSSNIISISHAVLKNGKALDKAFTTHAAKQTESIRQSTGQSKVPISKQITNNKITNKPLTAKKESDVFCDVKKLTQTQLSNLFLNDKEWIKTLITNNPKLENFTTVKNYMIDFCTALADSNSYPISLKEASLRFSGFIKKQLIEIADSEPEVLRLAYSYPIPKKPVTNG